MNSIPPEILETIGIYCDIRTVGKLSMVCKSYYRIFSSMFIILEGYVTEETIQYEYEKENQIDIKKIVEIRGTLHCEELNFPNLCKVTNLEIDKMTCETNLADLPNLQCINGTLNIYESNMDLCFLSSLILVGELIIVESDDSINHLFGLHNIIRVERNVSIQCAFLSSIEGLSSLSHVGGSICITSTHLKSLKGLHNLLYVGNVLDVGGCTGLDNLEGLEQLTLIGDYMGAPEKCYHEKMKIINRCKEVSVRKLFFM